MMEKSFPAGARAGRWWRSALVLAVAASVVPACGKKGPPLPPLLRLPAAVDNVSARRLGDTVYVRFTIPQKNQDTSTPGDIARVEVYGYTGTPERDEDMIKYGTLVSTILVRRPPPPEEEDRQRDKAANPAPKRAVEPEPGFDQGAVVTVAETLTAASMVPVVVPRKPAPKNAQLEHAAVEGPLPAARFEDMLARRYIAVAVNHKGRRGTPSRPVEVPLLGVPDPPAGVTIAFTEKDITITWPPAAGSLPASPAKQETVEGEEKVPLIPRRDFALGTSQWTYNVYEVPKPGAEAAKPPVFATPGSSALPVPLNPNPLAATTYADPRVEFGTERCYAVRTVRRMGSLAAESQPSEVSCVTPVDIFPPAAPKGLTVVATTGTMSLIWEPNVEADLAGYLVLRGEAGGGALRPITAAPLVETTYSDTTAKAGVGYVYAIVAVDKSGNISAQSNKVEETAR